MAKVDWDKVADSQFNALDKELQKYWNGLRKRVNHHHYL